MSLDDLLNDITDKQDDEKADEKSTGTETDSEEGEDEDSEATQTDTNTEGESQQRTKQLGSLEEHLEPIRAHQEAIEQFAEDRDGRIGAVARYFLSLAEGTPPDSRDCEKAGLPELDLRS